MPDNYMKLTILLVFRDWIYIKQFHHVYHDHVFILTFQRTEEMYVSIFFANIASFMVHRSNGYFLYALLVWCGLQVQSWRGVEFQSLEPLQARYRRWSNPEPM